MDLGLGVGECKVERSEETGHCNTVQNTLPTSSFSLNSNI